MISKTKLYNLLLNHQDDFYRTLKALGIQHPEVRIKDLLDDQLFDVIECDDNEIFAIKKKSTGEIFRKGWRFYYRTYDVWIDNAYFLEHELFGTHIGHTYYNNYIRGNSGLYHLNEISLTKKEPKEIEESPCEEVNLNGKIYVLKDCK